MNKYLIGGLVIATEIKFPELIETKEDADYTVSYGAIPSVKGKLIFDRVFMQIYDSDEVVFKIPELATYYIKGTSEVIMELDSNGNAADAEKYVITLVFGIISYKKGMYPLHGGGIVHNGKAILFTGQSGAGKSTTMAGLQTRGYTAVGDDIANLYVENGKVYVHPCFPRFKLWDQSMEILDKYNSGEYRLRQDMNKYLVPMDKFSTAPVEVDRIYLLKEEKENNDLLFEEKKGVIKINKLKRNSYKPFLVEPFGLVKNHFQLLNQIANATQFFEFSRKKNKKQVDEMLDGLIAHFDQNQ